MHNMNDEFDKLYIVWRSSYIFSAFGSFDPRAQESYNNLKNWCLQNKDEALKIICEYLKKEPSELVRLLNDIWGDEYNINVDGYVPLDAYCLLWLNIINNNEGEPIDYYKDWRDWNKHLEDNYISWRPNIEDDPNVTLEEYIEGKRNNKKVRKFHDFSLRMLNDEELNKLYTNGHLGDMTKYISELHHFYNAVEEEIKRRKIIKNK